MSVLFLTAFIWFASCNQAQESKAPIDAEKLKEPMIRANIFLNQFEEEQINDFIERHGWEMQRTGSGLRYLVYYPGNGTKVKEGMTAKISYTLRSISGDVIYSSAEGGPMEFMVGKGGVESGLEEAILLLHVGDKAKFVIPSHLGFGLAGDGHKIPSKATLIYDIELLAIN